MPLHTSHTKLTTAKSDLRLPLLQKIFYGLGHVFNDLCGNCWYSYLLLYMTKVASLSNAHAGLVLLIGQLADAVSTPFIGYGCDKTNFRYYGRRKLWHLIGTVCVSLSFPFIFNECLVCGEDASTSKRVIYYSGFASMFTFGWASVEISHLSLIPDIGRKNSQKVELNAIRSAVMFVCGIVVFCVTWFLLGTNPEASVSPKVAPQFMLLSFVVVGAGCLFSFVFHCGTTELRRYERKEKSGKGSVSKSSNDKKSNGEASKEKEPLTNDTPVELANGCPSEEHAKKIEGEVIDDIELLPPVLTNKAENGNTWKEWIRSPHFYKMAVVYMCTRLAMNVSQAYLALYLTETMDFPKEAIAYFPLLVLISGVVSSVLVKILTKRIGSKFTFIIGSLTTLVSFAWFFFVTKDARKSVYAAAILMGGGSSIMLVTSLAMIADLIGGHKASCAFVYSVMSFSYKLSSGIVIYIIQQLKPKTDSGLFTKYVQTVVTGVSCIIALFCVAVFVPSDFSFKTKKTKRDVQIRIILDEEANEIEECEEPCSDADTQKADLLSPTPLSDKLKRLSWHASMTSYIAFRQSSPYIPSPVTSRRTVDSTEPIDNNDTMNS